MLLNNYIHIPTTDWFTHDNEMQMFSALLALC